MNPGVLFWIAFASLVVTCLATIGARSIRVFSRRELEELCRRHQSDLKFSEIIEHDDQVAVSIECLHVIGSVLFVVAATSWAYLVSGANGDGLRWPMFWSIAGVAGVLLLALRIWIPWAVVRLWATPILFHTWRIWRLTSRILAPLILASRAVDTIFHRLAGRQRIEPTEDIFEDEIRSIVSEGHREGLLEEDAREMIEGIMQLSDADVAKAMTPRTDVIMIPLDTPWPEVLEIVINCPHTRIPVFQNTRDEVVGVLHAKDLLTLLVKNGEQRPPLADVLRPPLFVPETKRLDDLLEEFQVAHNHMALVLDEYGGVAGLVTIEDVLEEIVGEIVDEYDDDVEEEILKINDHTAEMLARVHIDEVNEQLGLALPDDDDFDTIGGFVFSQLGHVPEAGEEVVWNDVRIKVVEATPRRIERIQILLPESQREPA